MIDTYTIKTYTRQAYRNYGDASRVIEVVFRWILMRLNKSKSSVIRPEAIIAAMKRKSESPIRYEFEPSKLEHQIHIGSCTFLLRKDMSGCRIMIGVSSKRGFYLTYQNPEEIAKVLVDDPGEKKPKRKFLKIYLNVFFGIVFFSSLLSIDLSISYILEKFGIETTTILDLVLYLIYIISFALMFVHRDLVYTKEKTYKGEK